MYLYQFLAEPSGSRPVVFEGVLGSTMLSTPVRTAYQSIGHVPGMWDAFGTDQAPFEPWELTFSSDMRCRIDGRLREPASRAARRLLGQRGWIIGYRFENCACPTCGSDCMCGFAVRQQAAATWYGTTGRLIKLDGTNTQGDGSEYGLAAWTPQLSFMIERPWERLVGRNWGFGDLKITVDGNRQQLGVNAMEDLIAFRHQPCAMSKVPSHGYWWRLPHARIARYPFVDENCVQNWSAGGWIIGYAARYNQAAIPTTLYVPGDWPPDARLAFTNFTTITIAFKHNGIVHSQCTFSQSVASPQYLYIDTINGETSIRYCPVSDNPCLDLEALATYVPEAAVATPVAVTFTVGNGLALLRPGWNEMSITGRHLPGSEFRWSYDIVPQWS